MNQGQLVVDIINDGVFVAFIVCLIFPVIGAPRIGFWPWYRSDWGWNIVLLEEAITLALLPIWAHRFMKFDAPPLVWLWIDAVSIWLIPVIVIWRVYIIWRTQRYQRNKGTVPKEGNSGNGDRKESE
jgi:hypothetical protein